MFPVKPRVVSFMGIVSKLGFYLCSKSDVHCYPYKANNDKSLQSTLTVQLISLH